MSDRGALQIQRLDSSLPDQVARWEAFVAACPKATFFHRAGWQTVIRDVFRHPTYFLFAEQDGEMLGVLPLAIASGAGSGAQRAIGTGVIGGMLAGTFLGIFFIPLFFVTVRRLFYRKEAAR